ncbi:hypothetical protein [Streptomyces sp. NPDC047985]|uniref:hypothetical protein n=1 Tax=Streptomyces sp. NPDC047985 TaxID=3155384 RepID=UPI0034302B2D
MSNCSGTESSDRDSRQYRPLAAVFSSASGWCVFIHHETICRQVSPYGGKESVNTRQLSALRTISTSLLTASRSTI